MVFVYVYVYVYISIYPIHNLPSHTHIIQTNTQKRPYDAYRYLVQNRLFGYGNERVLSIDGCIIYLRIYIYFMVEIFIVIYFFEPFIFIGLILRVFICFILVIVVVFNTLWPFRGIFCNCEYQWDRNSPLKNTTITKLNGKNQIEVSSVWAVIRSYSNNT